MPVNHADTGLIPARQEADTPVAQARPKARRTGRHRRRATPMNKLTNITATVAIALSGLGGLTSQAAAEQGGRAGSDCHLSLQEVADWGETSTHMAQACDEDEYTVLDHPALPCRLSVEAVANWGETSAHLPLACTYDE
jgi:hypothetical protein